MLLRGKENKPLKQKDVVRLDELQVRHPGDLTEEEKVELAKLQMRRELYGEV